MPSGSNGRPTHLSWWWRLIVGVVVLAVVGLGWVWATGRGDATSDIPVWTPTPTATATGTPSPASTRPSSATTVTPLATPSRRTPPAPGCLPTAREIDPVRFVVEDIGVDSPMLSLGTDASGTPEAPPLDDPAAVGWWNQGPRVGADKGNAIITIHTYRQGGALGNKLASDEGLRPGMVVRMTDASGQTMCYRFERATKLWVKDYDPHSKVLYDFDGKPQAVIIICWDFNRGTEEWDSRILYYLTPMAA